MSRNFELERLRLLMGVKVTDEWAARMHERIFMRHQQKKRRASGALAVSFAAIACIVWFFVSRAELSPPPDRSSVTALTADATIVPEHSSELRLYHLERGAARFQVTHEPDRPLRVVAGPVNIQVIGTDFDVKRLENGHVLVEVREGAVRVKWEGAEQILQAGERGTFPAPAPTKDTKDARVPSEAELPPEVKHAPASGGRQATGASPTTPLAQAEAPSWRELAQRGEHRKAAEKLRQGEQVENTPSDLLLASDAARLSGDPAGAATYLRKLLSGHASSNEASLAAFVLGRVLLDELGQPQEAAAAFARASRGGGPLQEDATARQVEALQKAGQKDAARKLAADYLKRYPKGRYRAQVRKVQGIHR